MQNSAIFKGKNLKINLRKIKNIVKLDRDHCHYTGEYKGAVHTIRNLKYSVPK